MFKSMPIDKLLRWALCEELPKGQPVSASAWEAVTRNLVLGMRIDVSKTGAGDGLGIVPGDPHPDAVIIADELRRLPKAHRIGAERLAQIIGELHALDLDAFNALAPAPFNLPALLIRCAVLRPIDVPAIEPRPAPVMSMPAPCSSARAYPIVFGVRDGDLCALQSDAKGRYKISDAPRCHVQWTIESGEPISGAFESRAEYAAWIDGLRMLGDAIGERKDLIEYSAGAPSASAEPWHIPPAELPATLPIVQGGAPVSRDAIPLAPKRKAPGAPIKSLIEQKQEERNRQRARDRAKAAREARRKSADKTGLLHSA